MLKVKLNLPFLFQKMASSSTKRNPNSPFVILLLLLLPLELHVMSAMAAEGQVLGKKGEQRAFDYFILALQWPATACSNTRRCCAKNGCCRGANSPTEFTIHGLWPEYNESGWPSCCTDKVFNANEISTLNEDLEKYWPTYRCGTTSTCHRTKGSFWAHEFEKHGTCATPVLVGEYDYFLTTITVFSKHNVTKALNDAGIVASDTESYPLGDVIAAVQDAFHAAPKLSCTRRGAVKELWICFDKNLEPRDCDTPTTCLHSITFPTYEPKGPNSVDGEIPWVADAEAI